MTKHFQHILLLALISLGSTLLIWAPFFLGLSSFWNIRLPRDGMAAVVRNFDGPYYIVTAKSLYQADAIKQFEFDLPVEYYAAHYPLYPLFIKLLGPLTGFPYAMLGTTLAFSVAAVVMFYILLKELKIKSAFWLSLFSLFLPARYLITRSVGSPEPIFIFLVLLSIFGFYRKNYWLAGIAGGLAQLTKPPGGLLFAAYGLYLGWDYLAHRAWDTKYNKNRNPTPGVVDLLKALPWRALPLLLIPVSLFGLFYFYSLVYGSFWAWFQSGDNIHLFWPPFQMFNTAADWVGTFWLEDIVWLLLIGALAMIINWKRQDIISWFTAVFYLSTIFVSHRDLARYSLPLAPFIIIAFAPFLKSKTFRYAFFILLIPIYLYTINFIAGNTTPISDWERLL